MISYFKYDAGNAFLLKGNPYTGFFHVQSGIAYTGKIFDASSEVLSSKGNFLAEFYLNQYEFDVFAGDNYQAAPFVLNSFDILNKAYLEQAFDQINENNLLVFKHLIIQDPNLFPITRSNTHFYGLSSTDADIRNDDVPSGKRSYTHIDPFSFDSEWAFLDSIISGDIIIDGDDNFLYFCSDGTTQYTLSGSFVNFEPIVLMTSQPSSTFYIKQDTVDDKLFFVSLTAIQIFDLQNYIRCQTFDLLDEIPVTIQEENKHLVKIGKNIRTEVVNGILNLKNKYSTELYASYNLGPMICLDIREVDDLVAYISRYGDDYYLGQFDPNDFAKSYTFTKIFGVGDDAEIIFSGVDSNVFYVSTNSVVQGRLLSNPTQSFGQTNDAGYFYLNDYIYGTTDEAWGSIQIKYNSNSLPSNTFNNLLFKTISKETNQYLLTHNIGRIYASKLDMSDTYLNAIPLDIAKSYNGTTCSESSFGLFFNVTILNLVKDTLRLYGMAAETYSLSASGVGKNALYDLTFEIDNLYINGNESVNIVSIQRILSLINFIQNELIS